MRHYPNGRTPPPFGRCRIQHQPHMRKQQWACIAALSILFSATTTAEGTDAEALHALRDLLRVLDATWVG